MKIKNLDKADELPMRSSMRKSCGVSTWDIRHHCGKRLWGWTDGFARKHIGEPFDEVYSEYKKRLKRKHVNSEDCESMIWYFKNIVNYHENNRYYFRNRHGIEVDDEGILKEIPKKKKNRNITINYGKSETYYVFDPRYKANSDIYNKILSALIEVYGYHQAYRMAETGISVKEHYNTLINRFNNLCSRKNIRSYYSRYCYSCIVDWEELWEKRTRYIHSITFKYRSPEYYKYRYETLANTRRINRILKKERIDKFNAAEIKFNEHPILIE